MKLAALQNAVGATLDDYNEASAVELALDKMPPIKTVGTQWYEYKDGAWRKIESDRFRPVVLSILGEEIQTNRRVVEILKHIESKNQVLDEDFQSFYCFDSDAVLLNAANGIVQARLGDQFELLRHDPKFNFTQQLEASYSRNAVCPIFTRVLSEALPDPADRDLLQLFVGSLLLPSCKFEAALVCIGPGGTGKSTIAEAIAGLFGVFLVERIGMSNICDPKSYYLPKLKHVAVNLGTELDALEVGESGNFKALVSGEKIAVRSIYAAPYTMETTAKLWFLSNNMPRFKHGTDAELRRMRFLRFDKVPLEKDVDLKQKLVAERDGIFLWALHGLSRLLSLKEMPLGGAESRQVHDRFAITNDPLGAFISSRCRLDSKGNVLKDHFRDALFEFCDEHAIPFDDPTWMFKLLWGRYPELRQGQVTLSGNRVREIHGLELL